MQVAAGILPPEAEERGSVVLNSRLLVVDEQRAFVGFARILARGMGYETSAVLDIRELAAHVKAWHPTVLIVEVVMPDVDWIEIIGMLAGAGFDGQLILVTARESTYLERARTTAEAKGLRVAACLTKPVRTPEMILALQQCISASGPIHSMCAVPAAALLIAQRPLGEEARERELQGFSAELPAK